MSIRQAVLSDLHTVRHISVTTIAEVYPHYYPKGAVDFFWSIITKQIFKRTWKESLSFSVMTVCRMLSAQLQ